VNAHNTVIVRGAVRRSAWRRGTVRRAVRTELRSWCRWTWARSDLAGVEIPATIARTLQGPCLKAGAKRGAGHVIRQCGRVLQIGSSALRQGREWWCLTMDCPATCSAHLAAARVATCIAATTLGQYRQHIVKDAALPTMRRFRPSCVDQTVPRGHHLHPPRPESARWGESTRHHSPSTGQK